MRRVALGKKQASVLTLPVLSGGRATRTSRESGTRMYGTIYGATCVGGAYSFDGIDDYIEIVMPENISFVDSFQVSMRVQIVDNPVDRYRYFMHMGNFALAKAQASLVTHLLTT
jgi:hypothetical protein